MIAKFERLEFELFYETFKFYKSSKNDTQSHFRY